VSRYQIPDPKCHHKATVRVSSHADLAAAAKTREPMASTYCCDREACQDDAKEWLQASTRRDAAVIVPLRSRSGAS
jgi:hypothetical protein